MLNGLLATTGGDAGVIVAAVITGLFLLLNTWQNHKLGQKQEEHTEGIGSRITAMSEEVKKADISAQLIALELAQFKQEHAAEAAAQKRALEDSRNDIGRLLGSHIQDDVRQFAELRQLLVMGLGRRSAEDFRSFAFPDPPTEGKPNA